MVVESVMPQCSLYKGERGVVGRCIRRIRMSMEIDRGGLS